MGELQFSFPVSGSHLFYCHAPGRALLTAAMKRISDRLASHNILCCDRKGANATKMYEVGGAGKVASPVAARPEPLVFD